MAKDPQKESNYDERGAPDDDSPRVGLEERPEPERPTCPRCGWHNTRPSRTRGIDWILRWLWFRAFRCRSCGNRFQVLQRTRKA